MDELMKKLNTIMNIEIRNKALLQRMIELNEIIELNYITGMPDINASLEYICIEAIYAQGEWAASCIKEDLSDDMI